MSTSKAPRRTRIKVVGYRPGRPVPDGAGGVVAKHLDIRIVIPTQTADATDDDLAVAGRLRDSLRQFSFVSELRRIQDANYVAVRFRVAAPAATEDELLSDCFLQLRPVLDVDGPLRQGLSDDKPYWEALKVTSEGDFVADKGYFNPVTGNDEGPTGTPEPTPVS